MSFQLFNGQTVSNGTKIILALSGLVIALVAIASIGGAAATTEIYNDSVTSNEDGNVTASVTWNDSISDPANTSASVTFYNATEFSEDPSTATVVLEDEIPADAGNTTTTDYTELGNSTDYQLVIEGDDAAIDSVSVDDSSGWVPFLSGGGSEGSALVGLALIAGGGWFAKENDLI